MYDKHKMYMDVALALSLRSKCVSLSVGAVLVKNDNIISTGINGTPKGSCNCNEKFTERSTEHSAWSELNEVHAEMNAILRCNVDKVGAIMYSTTAPCVNCLKHSYAAGIKDFVYLHKYYRMSEEQWLEIIDYCEKNKINFTQLEGE